MKKRFFVKFLKYSSLVLFLVGCQNDLYRFNSKFNLPKISSESPIVLVVIDAKVQSNFLEIENLKKTLEYTKIPYKTNLVDGFNLNPQIPKTIKVLSLQQTIGLTDASIDSITNFVAKGGILHIPKMVRDPRMAFLMGLKPEAKLETNTTAKGFYFNKPVFPDKMGLVHDYVDPFIGLDKDNFKDNIHVLVSAANDKDYPVLLENKVGDGKVILINTSFNLLKNMRGFLFSSLIYGLEGVPYPVANVATIFLDDYPSPTYNIYKEPIKSEMDLSISEYVKDVWWPDMKKLAKRHRMKYTAYVTFDYNSNVYPPFGFLEWDQNRLITNEGEESSSGWLGKNILNSGHELGFHGYNHVSLLKVDWKNPNYIITALNAAEKKWKVLGFENLPISYVPPSNYIDSVGLQKLHEGMPSLRFMQSTYLGKVSEGGGREFDPDPLNSHFFDYPRISSGYNIETASEWAIESMYIYTGIWTHFVHPDDVYQIPDESNATTSGHFEYRNKHNLNWYSSSSEKGLLEVFEDYLIDYEARHPFTRFLNATDGSYETINWRYAEYAHTIQEDIYEVESFNSRNKNGLYYWLMYVDKVNDQKISDLLYEQNIRYKKVPYLDGYLFSLETKNPSLAVLNLNPTQQNNVTNIIAKVNKERDIFYDLQASLMSFGDRLKRYVANDNLPQATQLIENYLKVNPMASSQILMDYAQYMVWQGKEDLFWKTLDTYYQKNSNEKIAFLAHNLNLIVGYPTTEVRRLWMNRQLKHNTTNVVCLKEYYNHFNTLDNSENISKVLKKLSELSPTSENTERYLEHLIYSKANNLIEELNQIEPCSIYDKELATSIAWTYADALIFEKALHWQKCSLEISNETIEYWTVNSKDFIKYKQSNFSYYIGLLLANDERKASQELRGVPACREDLVKYANKITKVFGDLENYRNAVAWSKCATEIDIKNKMTWLFELGQMQSLTNYYNEYMQEHSNDYEIKNYMSTLYLYDGKITQAIRIAFSIPPQEVDPKLILAINNEVKEMELKQQLEISKLYLDILDPSTVLLIEKKKRQFQGASLGADYNSINDKLDPTMSSFSGYYEFYNQKGNVHRFSFSQSSMYTINVKPRFASNVNKDLIGLGYRYKLNPGENSNYLFKGRIEKDNDNELYFQAGIGYNKTKGTNYSAYQVDIFPVQSGPGYELNIYRTLLNVYKEIPLSNLFKQILALEANYYTDSGADATFVGRYEYNLISTKKLKLNPYIEGAIGRGTLNRRSGYPYWMAEERMFGGAGILFTIGNSTSKIKLIADFSLFAEDKRPDFERYTGSIIYRFTDYFTFNGAYEFYTIDNFYSNVFQLGINYKFE